MQTSISFTSRLSAWLMYHSYCFRIFVHCNTNEAKSWLKTYTSESCSSSKHSAATVHCIDLVLIWCCCLLKHGLVRFQEVKHLLVLKCNCAQSINLQGRDQETRKIGWSSSNLAFKTNNSDAKKMRGNLAILLSLIFFPVSGLLSIEFWQNRLLNCLIPLQHLKSITFIECREGG